MIKRYSNLEIEKIWSIENKYSIFLKIEIASLKNLSSLGIVPKKDYLLVSKNAKFDVNRIREIEKETNHDVIAFINSVLESLGEEGKWFHYGLTSTDLVDTALAIQLKEVNTMISEKLNKFNLVLKKKAKEYIDLPTIGRTHGIHAEITSFGLKFALLFDEMNRNIKRFEKARELIECGKISGSVGNFANIPFELQDRICKDLKIGSAKISTQVLSRDIHSNYLFALTSIASTLEKMALEFRHLQRTEVSELFESFSKNQKGSSSMPHKKNPISSENITGLSRVLKGNLFTALENNQLWHERDISHSSAERIILPDSTILIHYMLNRSINLLENIFVDKKKVLSNINLTKGRVFSQRILHELIKKGMSRKDAYDFVQSSSTKSSKENINLKDLLITDKLILKYFSKEEIESIFLDFDYYLKNSRKILKRLGIK